MARIPYLNQEDLAPENRDLLKRPINLNRALVNSPNARRASAYLANYIRYESKLDPRLRELAILQVGYLVRSPYEWSHHLKLAPEFGVSENDVQLLIDSTEGRPTQPEELTDAVLCAAREMTLGLSMSDKTFIILRNRLDTEQLTDLVLTISYYNCVVRILATLQIDVEEEYLTYLERFPLPNSTV